LTNITGSKRCQTKSASSAGFHIKHSLEDTRLLLLELAKVIL